MIILSLFTTGFVTGISIVAIIHTAVFVNRSAKVIGDVNNISFDLGGL